MKKIGIVVPWFGMDIAGGSEAEIRGLALHLAAAGIKLEVLTTCVKDFYSDWNKNYHEQGLVVENGIVVRRFGVNKRNDDKFNSVNMKLMNNQIPLTAEDEAIYVNEMINSTKLYQYMDTHQAEYSIFLFIPYMYGTTYHGVQVCPQKSILIPCFHNESHIYLDVFKEAYCKIAGMIFHSQPEYELASKVYDLRKVNAKVLGEGVDTELEYDALRFRKKYNISSPYLLYAGRKDEGKNVDTLVKYFAEYKSRKNTSLKLVLIGGGEIKLPLSIRDEVYDLGFVPIQDKYDAYGAALFLCQPSLNESFSLVIMESWLCNRPVLVNAGCEVTKDFAIKSNGGLYFSDYFEFEGAVCYLENHADIANEMGRSGCKYVKDNFSWNIIEEKYMNFFKKLVDEL